MIWASRAEGRTALAGTSAATTGASAMGATTGAFDLIFSSLLVLAALPAALEGSGLTACLATGFGVDLAAVLGAA